MNHWGIEGTNIVSEMHVSGDYSRIAVVTNQRACMHLVRYSQLGEEAEEIMDKVMGGHLGTPEAVAQLQAAVRNCIKDTAGSAPAKCFIVKETKDGIPE